VSPITDATLKFLDRYRSIELSGGAITNEGLKSLRRNTKLERLDLSDESQITDSGIENLVGIPNLKELVLDLTITDRSLAAIARMPSLRVLDSQSSLQEISDAGIAKLKGLPSLEKLTLTGNGGGSMSDDTPPALAAITSLREITLGGGRVWISGKGYSLLSELPNLKKLSILDGEHLTDADVGDLGKLVKLEEMELIRTKITASGKAALEKALPTTHVRWSESEASKLSNAQIAFLSGLSTANRTLNVGPVLTGRLASADAREPDDGDLVQAWSLSGCEGREVQIDLKSGDFDAFLVVLGSDLGKPLFDDDSGDDTDARLKFKCATPPYKIIVKSLDDPGQFTLQVTAPDK
jgi:hypothetical protein